MRTPDKLTAILHDIVALNDRDHDALTKLLSETTLRAIIKAASLVTSWQKFLSGFEQLLFDPGDFCRVGERDHLHRLLERELRIFDEDYHVMNSERGLTDMLRMHLKLQACRPAASGPSRGGTGHPVELISASCGRRKSSTARAT